MTHAREHLRRRDRAAAVDAAGAAAIPRDAAAAGRGTLVDAEHGDAGAMRAVVELARRANDLRGAAAAGVAGAGQALPFLDQIQRAFGRYDISGVRAQVGGVAADACAAIGAEGYAHGDAVAFTTAPDLFTAAHEAAHVLQQRAGVDVDGGIGRAGDRYEQEANAVAAAVVAGESAEPLLAQMVGAPRTAPAAGKPAAVQRFGEGELRERQARQPWDTATLDGPLGGNDTSIEPAVRANQALGFTRAQISILRVALGLFRAQGVIERRFVQAVRRFQRDGAVAVGTQMDGTDGTGARPAEVAAAEGASGILDEATVMRLDVSGQVTAAARQSYGQPPWTRFSAAEIDDIRLQLTERFELSPGDLVPRPRGGGARASAHFMARAAAWQLWTYRGRAVVYGRLGTQELSDLRTGVAHRERTTAQPEPEAETAVGTAPETARATDTGTEGEGGEATDAEAAGPADRPEAERLEIVRRDRAELARLLDTYRRAHRAHDAAAETAAAAALRTRMETMRSEVLALELPRTDFSRSVTFARPHVTAQYMLRELDYILDPTQAPPHTPVEERAAAVEATSPLERRTVDEAMDHLRDEHVIVDETTTRPVTRWDSRVGEGGDPDRVAPRAEHNAALLAALRARIETHRTRLAAVTRGRVDRLDQAAITSALQALAVEDFATQPGWRPLPDSGDRRTSRELDPSTRPDLLERGAIGTMDPAARVRLARAWSTWLGNTSRAIGDGTSRGELRRQRGFATTHPSSVAPANLVEVDLHRTGVTVTNNRGNPLPTSEMRLDPQFADAMVRFIRELAGLGVSELWTSAFLRNPTSSQDTHPRGQACDITGFLIGSELLHLRSGRPQDPPPAGDAAAMQRYMAVGGGHSDWFDHTGRIGSQTHEEVMHAITNMMRRYFSKIIGPGNDARHMGHWHVELTGRGRDGPQVQAQMLDRDQRTETTDAADRHEPGWRTPDERASFPDEE